MCKWKWKWNTRIQLSPTRNEFSTIHARNSTTFSHNTWLLFLTENYEHRVNAFKRMSETLPLFPQYMPFLVDSLKKWEWTHWIRRIVGCLCDYDRLPSHMCKCNSRFPGSYVSSWLSSNFLTTRNEFSTIHARSFTPCGKICLMVLFFLKIWINSICLKFFS